MGLQDRSYICSYNPSIFFARVIGLTAHLIDYAPAKTCMGNIKLHVVRRPIHLALNYSRIFVHGHYLFREANSSKSVGIHAVLKIGEYHSDVPKF